MLRLFKQIEQEKYELRIISRDLQREQLVENLKEKYMISGTIKEQKQQVRAKRRELNDETIQEEDDDIQPVTPEVVVVPDAPVVEPENADTILDPQSTEESAP